MSWSSSDRSQRLPPNWNSEIRPAVFAAYGDVCHLCGNPGSDGVDHLQAGDDHSLANLRPVHDKVWPRCHGSKSSWEGNETQRRIRAAARQPKESHPGLL